MQEKKHVVIVKKHAVTTTTAAAKPRSGNHDAHASHSSVAPVPHKKKSNGPFIAGVVVVVLVLLGGVFGLWHVYQQKQMDIRRVALALQEKKKQADDLYACLPSEMVRIEKLLEDGNVHFNAVKEIVLFVTGSAYGARKETPRAPVAVAKPAAAPLASAPAPKVDVAPVAAEEYVPASDGDAPAGVFSSEELAQMKAGGRPGEDVEAAPAPAPAPAPAAAGDAPAGVFSSGELARMKAGNSPVQEVPAPGSAEEAKSEMDSADAARHKTLLDLAKVVAEDMALLELQRSQLMELQPEADQNHADALHATQPAVAAVAVTALEKKVQSAKDMVAESVGILKKIEAQAADAVKMQAEEVRVRTVRADEDRRRSEAEELRVRTEREVARVASLYAMTKDPIRRFAFAEALALLEQAQPEFTTEPGRAALDLPMERTRRLQRLKTLMTDCLNTNPFHWGWGTAAANSQDILGADETGIRIPRGTVAWAEIPLPQLMKIFAYFTKTARARSSEQAEDGIALAILLDELGKKTEAREQLDNALKINSLMSGDARRLLPDYR